MKHHRESLFCDICGVELGDDQCRENFDCGGTCLSCMADIGDPECEEAMKKIAKRNEKDAK